MCVLEFGDIDHQGHDNNAVKMARYLDGLLREVCARIEALLTAGWKRVHVVTDHGWLLMPGGLPKIDLPSVLTSNKWGRCAAIKPGATTQERLYPWFWNPSIHFALADGISCFRAGLDYVHGGLSLQECLTPGLIVTKKYVVTVEFADIVWKGLRCSVEVDGNAAGLSIDIRTQPGNPASSVAASVKPLKDNGTGSVVVIDEELEKESATVVLLDADGKLVAQLATVIGEHRT